MGNRLRNCRDCNQLTYNVNKICSECFTKAKTKISDRLDSLHNMLKKYIYCEECIKQLEYYQNLKSCLCDHCVIIFDRLYGRFNNYGATKIKSGDGVSTKSCKRCQDRESFIDFLFRVICEPCIDNYRKYCENKLKEIKEEENEA